MGKEGRTAKLPRNTNKERIISQDNDSLSLFAPSDVEDESKGDKDDPLRWIMKQNNQKVGYLMMTFCSS